MCGALFLLGVTLSFEVAVARWWRPVDEALPWYRIVFDYVKFVFIFFLAGQALSFLASVNKEARDSAGVNGFFGLNNGPGTVLFVLPVFEAKRTTEILRHKASERESPRFHVLPPTHKELDDKLLGTFCRYDVVAAMEMAMLLSRAGGTDFMVLDDRAFLARVDEAKQSEAFIIKRGREDVRVVSVVVIGLWSNLVSSMLSSSDNFPYLHLQEYEARPGERSLKVGVGDEMAEVTYNERTADKDGEPAVVVRREFKEFVLTVVGGLSSTGTLRVGDFLLRDHGALASLMEQFADDCTNNTFTTVAVGRPSGSGPITFAHDHPGNQSGRSLPSSFCDTFGGGRGRIAAKSDVKKILGTPPDEEVLSRDPIAMAAVERARHGTLSEPIEEHLP